MASSSNDPFSQWRSPAVTQPAPRVTAPTVSQPERPFSTSGQMLAGLHESLLSAPNAEGIERAIPGFVLDTYGLANIVTDYLFDAQLPGADRAAELSNELNTQANDTWGVDNPDNAVEMALRIAPSLVGPGAASSGVRAVDAATETLLPLRQSTSIPGAAAAGALPVAANETLVDVLNTPESQYTTVMDRIAGPSSDPFADWRVPSLTDPVVDEAIGNQLANDDALRNTAIAGLALLGGGVVARRMWRNHRNRQLADTTQPRASDSSALTGAIFDETAPMLDVARQTMDDAGYSHFEDQVATMGNPSAIHQRVTELDITGEFPRDTMLGPRGSSSMWEAVDPHAYDIIRTQKPLSVLHDEYNAIPNKQDVYTALQYLDELDDRTILMNRATGTVRPHSLIARRRFTDQTDDALRSFIDNVRSDPRASQFIDDVHAWFRAHLDYAKARGRITDTEYQNLVRTRPHFMHLRSPGEEAPWWKRMFGLDQRDSPKNVVFSLSSRNLEPNAGLEDVDDLVRSMRGYSHSLVRDVEQNNIRRSFFDSAGTRYRSYADQSKSNDRVPVAVAQPRKGRNGQTQFYRYYEVDDDAVRQALLMQPETVHGLMNTMRRVYQTFTTGIMNPLFAPVSALYDATLATRLGADDFKVGFLPKSWAKYGFDITTYPGALSGAMRGIYASSLHGAETIARQIALNDPFLAQMLGGPGNLQRFSKRMGEAYANTTLHLFAKYGMGHSRHNIEPMENLEHHIIENRYGDAAVRSYRAFLDSIQNGMRLHLLAANIRKGMSDTEIEHLGRRIRESTGDFSKIGSSPYTKKFVSWVPYGNVGLQSARRYAQLFRESPRRFMTGIAVTTLFPVIMQSIRAEQLGEEYVNHLWNELSWIDRITKWRWYLPGEPPENALTMRILPEDALVVGPALAFLDSIRGYSTGQYKEDREFGDYIGNLFRLDTADNVAYGMQQAANRVFSPGVPPAVDVGAAAFNMRVDFANGLPQLEPIYDPHIQEGRFISDALHNKRYEAMLTGMLGLTGRNMLEAGRAFDRAYTGTEDLSTAIDDSTDALVSTNLSQLPGGNVITGTSDRLSPFNDTYRVLKERKEAMDALTEQANTYERGGGAVTRMDSQESLQGFGVAPFGGIEGDILQEVRVFANFHQSNTEPRISALLDQIQGIEVSSTIPYANKQQMQNDLTRQLNELREVYLNDIVDFEQAISQQYGVPFSLKDFSPR